MKVARMMFTMLNRMSSSSMRPRIHNQLTAMGRKAMRLSSNRPNENQRKRKTITPHDQPM